MFRTVVHVSHHDLTNCLLVVEGFLQALEPGRVTHVLQFAFTQLVMAVVVLEARPQLVQPGECPYILGYMHHVLGERFHGGAEHGGDRLTVSVGDGGGLTGTKMLGLQTSGTSIEVPQF